MLRYLKERKEPELDFLRKSLFDSLQENCTSAQNWKEFLSHEEATLQSEEKGNNTNPQCAPATSSVSLFNLYQWAAELVPESAEGYVKIWIGYCRWLWFQNQTEAAAMLRSGLISSFGSESIELLSEAAKCFCSLGEYSYGTIQPNLIICTV